MGIVIDVQKASHSKTGTCETLYFLNHSFLSKMFGQQKDLAIFAITVDFSQRHSCCVRIILRNYL